MELQELHKKVLALCADDYTGLWLIVSIVAENADSIDTVPEWVHKKTIDVVGDLLKSGLIVAGYIDTSSHKFQSFDFSVEDTISYIQREWKELGRTPNIGDICEFFVTPAGEQLARELNLI